MEHCNSHLNLNGLVKIVVSYILNIHWSLCFSSALPGARCKFVDIYQALCHGNLISEASFLYHYCSII